MSTFVLLFSLTSLAFAQDSASPDDEEDTRELRQRVRTLEHVVDELRGVSEGPQAEIPLDLEMRFRAYTALNLNYLDTEQRLAFNVDDLMLQYTANLDRKMTVNVETSFEVEEEGLEVELETMEMAFAPRPQAQIVAGAFNLPLSPWASNASQGAFRYLPTTVPTALKEGDGDEFLPLDQLGVQLRGHIPLGFWQLSYDMAVTNGRAADPGTRPYLFDPNTFKALTGRVALQAPSGLSFGVGGYYDLVDIHDPSILTEEHEEGPEEWAAETVVDDAGEALLSGTVHWHGGPVDLSIEGYLALHTVDGESYSNYTAFALVGVPIRRTTPFLMLDTIHVDENDPVYQYFDPVHDEVEILPGFRYDLGLRVAFKSELEFAYDVPESSWAVGAQAQLAAGF